MKPGPKKTANSQTASGESQAIPVKGFNLQTDGAEADGMPAYEQRIRPVRATFRNILLVVFLILVCAIVQMLMLWRVCNTGMKTAASMEHQGLPTLSGLALLQQDLAIYRLNAYEYLFAQQGEKAGKAKAVQEIAAKTHAELEKIKPLLPEDEGRRLASDLENAFAALDTEFRKVQNLEDSDFAGAMKVMDRDIPPLTGRVTAAANAFSDYGYHFSGGQANATFDSFGWIKKNAIMFGAANIAVSFGAVMFVLLAARRSRAQLSQTMARLDERTGELQREINERNKAEEVVRESQALYHSLVEQLPAGVFRKDAAGHYVFVNSWFCRVKGMKAEQFLGKTPREFNLTELAGNSGTDFERREKLMIQRTSHHELIMENGKPIEFEEEYPDASGDRQYFHVVKSAVFGHDGKVIGSQGILFDITQRKQIEAKLAYERDLLRALMDHSDDSIYFKDAESRFIRCSANMAKHFQLQSMADLIGRRDSNFFSSEHAGEAFADEQKIIQTGEAMTGKIEKETWSDGRVTWALTSKMPFRDNGGQIIGTFGISKDITSIKVAEEKLAEVHKQLVDASHRAGMAEIATSVLHNVGNVLNSVNVSSTLIADKVRSSKVVNLTRAMALINGHRADLGNYLSNDPKGKKLPEYLASLAAHLEEEQRNIMQEIGSLVNNIIHIKEIVSMQQNYAKASGVKESLKVADLVEDAISMNTGSTARHHVKVVREYAEVPPILTEKHKILQILVNLIRNAKYACDDSGHEDKQITLRIANGNGRVKISVIDNGVGIPPENLTRIFNHGFTTRKGGHGFGLHSGALAAKELGGGLTVFSEGPGRGADFTLELPVKQPNPTL